MLGHRHSDKICICAAAVAAVIVIIFMMGESMGISRLTEKPLYAEKLFDPGRVHRIDIETESWEKVIGEAAMEEYSPCDIIIDGEKVKEAGIRAKGNNSLNLTEKYGHSRYSIKVEFDHYIDGGSYLGLDKMSLDASFQDNSYMKTFLAYDMMDMMDVPAPLCSYAWVTVNGEDWGCSLQWKSRRRLLSGGCTEKITASCIKPDYRSLEDENADVALKYTTMMRTAMRIYSGMLNSIRP